MKFLYVLALNLIFFLSYSQSTFQAGAGVRAFSFSTVDNIQHKQDCPNCPSYISSYNVVKKDKVAAAYNFGFHHSFKQRNNFNFRLGMDLYYSKIEYEAAIPKSEPVWPYLYITKFYENRDEVEFAIPLHLEYHIGKSSIYVGPSLGLLAYTKFQDPNAWQVHFNEEYFPKYINPRFNVELGYSYKLFDRFSVGINNRFDILNKTFMATANVGYYLPSIKTIKAKRDSSQWKLRFSPLFLELGLIVEHKLIYELGLKFEYARKKQYSGTWRFSKLVDAHEKFRTRENFSLIAGSQYFRTKYIYGNILMGNYVVNHYFNPFITLRYYKPINNGGLLVQGSISRKKIDSEVSKIVTPEVGWTFADLFSLSYGYNFFLDKKFSWEREHRFILRVMLN